MPFFKNEIFIKFLNIFYIGKMHIEFKYIQKLPYEKIILFIHFSIPNFE